MRTRLARDDFRESEHPRGQPGNPGQFAPSPGGGSKTSEPGKGSGSSERLPDETDKQFAKRIVDKRKPPKELPEKYNYYFETPPGTKIIPLDDLVSTKSEEENQQGDENGAKRMEAAANGELGKRGPITVKKRSDGKYEIVDGNGTYSSVKKYGWKGLPATVENQQPDFKGSLAFESKADTTQPVKSVEELYERAKKEEKTFKDTMEFIADAYGSKVEYTPPEYAEPGTILKSMKSAERKLNSDLGGDATKLLDVIRATIVSDSVENTRKAAAAFIGKYGDDILRVKDRYTDVMKGGYRDILINYRTPGGLVAEVQFNSKNMVTAKNETAHVLYEEQRALVNPTPNDLERLEQQMAEIYDKAYQADGDGKGWKHSIQAHDTAENAPLRRYKLTPPDGPSFEAAIVNKDGTISVITNRSGNWEPEPELKFTDLVMPEQAFGEDWEVSPMEPGTIEQPQDKRRALDRSTDIEYYTSETIGPKRERTPEGFMICYDVPVARVGEMLYGPGEVPDELGLGHDGRIHVQRSPASVFDPRSMASLNGKPVTDDHPPVDVEPGNWQFYTRGVVVNPRRGDGDMRDFLLADLIIYDKEMIEDIDAGKREVSCGYNPDYLQVLDDRQNPIPGRGEQVNILYNHLALVKAGRCGPYCSIGDSKTTDSDSFWTSERERRFRRLMRRFS